MKQFTKTRLLPFLLSAVTMLCAIFGLILTNPSTVSADAFTAPYDKELGFEVKEGDNLFGKYVQISFFNDVMYTFTVGNGDWEFCIGDDGEPTINVNSLDKLAYIPSNANLFAVEYIGDMGAYIATFDFTKECSFEIYTDNGFVEIVLNKETLVVEDVEACVLQFYPTYTYTTRQIVKGDNLAGKTIIAPCSNVEEGRWWEMDLDGFYLYYDESDNTVLYIEKENDEPVLEYSVKDVGLDKELCYCLAFDDLPLFMTLSFPEKLIIEDNGATYERLPVFNSVQVDGYENNFRILEFIEDEQPSDTPTDTPNETPDKDGKTTIDLEKIADWFNKNSEKVSDWLAERNIEMSGRSVIVAVCIIAIIIAIVKSKKRSGR